MARLTESYLRRLIKQVVKENMGSDSFEDVAHAVDQWYLAGDATVEEIAAELGVSAAAMHKMLDMMEEEDAREAEEEDPYDMYESRKRATTKKVAPKRKY